ncbi:MAG: LysM peptidoglycan-binding domain-containing protein [Bacteroidota bacterium]
MSSNKISISPKTKITFRYLPVVICYLLCSFPWSKSEYALAQVSIEKSKKIEVLDEKKFYIHRVEKNQTLYSIAKTYNTTVDIVLSNNPQAIDGLKVGQILKIPFLEKVESIIKEIQGDKTKEIQGGKTKEIQKVKTPVVYIKSPPDTIKNNSLLVTDSVVVDKNINVAFLLPFSLGSIDAIDIDKIIVGNDEFLERSRIAIEFYEGAKMAFDSLLRMGFKSRLFVYDAFIDSLSFVNLLKKPEFKEMDLIIGPLYNKEFNITAKFAKENNINIVSPIIQNNNILLGKVNVSKVTPSQITEIEEMGKYVMDKFLGQNILLFNSTNPKDKFYMNTFKKTVNSALVNANADTVKDVTIGSLKSFMNDSEINVVIIPSNDPSFVTEVLSTVYQLKKGLKDSVIIFGMQSWQDMESLDFNYLSTLSAHIPSSTFIDYENNETKKFILRHRELFKTEPSYYTFSGFDITYYYLNALKNYGHSLQRKLPDIKTKGLQTKFDFHQSAVGSGYENSGIFLLKFENYKLVKVK